MIMIEEPNVFLWSVISNAWTPALLYLRDSLVALGIKF